MSFLSNLFRKPKPAPKAIPNPVPVPDLATTDWSALAQSLDAQRKVVQGALDEYRAAREKQRLAEELGEAPAAPAPRRKRL